MNNAATIKELQHKGVSVWTVTYRKRVKGMYLTRSLAVREANKWEQHASTNFKHE